MLLKYGNFLNDVPQGNIDNTVPLFVNSCGTYRLSAENDMTTERPEGRNDFQMIYIAKGKGVFYFDRDKNVTLKAGSLVIYRPRAYQKYIYFGQDHPEIYWIHFTGSRASDFLIKYGICTTSDFMTVGDNSEYSRIFEEIILELQCKKDFYPETCTALFTNLLIRFARFQKNASVYSAQFSFHRLDEATAFFHEHYNEPIVIERYIRSSDCGLCDSLFYRQFKEYTGQTPLQYVLGIRLQNARELLVNSNYSIKEISESIGYDNALYFSRLFRKNEGMSPREYRQKMRNGKPFLNR